MASTPQTNLRLSPDIKDAAVAAAADRGVSLARLVEMALESYLEMIPGDTGGMVPHDPILHRLEAIERRLSALEGDTGGIPDSTAPVTPPPYPKAPPAPAQRTAPVVASYSAAPPDGHPKADGGRWLSTDQALELARARGYQGSPTTLRRWCRDANADGLSRYGLKASHHGTRDKSLASFEDLRHQPPE
jgi:hypothetical protein